MKIIKLNNLLSLLIAILLGFASIGISYANEVKVIKVVSDHKGEVEINLDDDQTKVFRFDADELNDLSIIDEKFNGFDEATKLRVKEALEKVKNLDGHNIELIDEHKKLEKFVVLNGEGVELELDSLSGDFEEFENKKVKIIEVFGGTSTDRIKQMITQGEFSQEELNQIQQALDAKR